MSKAAELAALIGSQTALSNRNLIINGAMQVAQRGDVTGITTSNKYGGADRFGTDGINFGTVSLTQEADAPEGFAESQRVKFTTARSTTGAGDHFIIGTRLEGQDLQRFKKGTSNAEYMTVSFYAKASQATTITLELFDADNDRHAGKEFAITTSWARYSYSFVGDTTGAFDNDNTLGMYVFFWLSAGTNFTSGTNPDGSWMPGTDVRRVHSDVGTTFMDTLNAEFNLTGVQLEVGEQATPFEHRSFADELQRCRRYLYRVETDTANGAFVNLTGWDTNNTYGSLRFPVEMRAAPSFSYGAALSDFLILSAGANYNPTTIQSNGNNKHGIELNMVSTSNITAGRSYWARISDTSNGFVQFDAEL